MDLCSQGCHAHVLRDEIVVFVEVECFFCGACKTKFILQGAEFALGQCKHLLLDPSVRAVFVSDDLDSR